jgi:DNA-directed RNA polymerase specialized sigma24 family protein
MEPLTEEEPPVSEPLPIHPYAVPIEDVPEVESLADDGSEPEASVFSLDHVGLATALDILSPRERQVLAMKIGLDESGEPHKSAEIAAALGLSIESVSSTLTRARNRLRSVPNIVGVINGEASYSPNGNDNTLQAA